MKKLCRVHKSLTSLKSGGDIVTQDSGNQPVYEQSLQKFMGKIKENTEIFKQDESVADAIAIQESINKVMPEFKAGGSNWMKDARNQITRKGTVGKFTEFCGGKVTADCIERALKSPDKTIQDRAKFALASRSSAMAQAQWGGSIQEQDPEMMYAQAGKQVDQYAQQGPGVTMDVNIMKEDPNQKAWEETLDNMSKRTKRKFKRGMNNVFGGINQVYNAPDRYVVPEDHQLFKDAEGRVNLNEFSITGYTPGAGGKKSTINYNAKGTTNKGAIKYTGSEGYDGSNPIPKNQVGSQNNNQVHPYDWSMPDLDVDEEVIGMKPFSFDQGEFATDLPEAVYPNQLDFDETDPNAERVDFGVEEDGSFDLEKQSKFKTARQNNPYLASDLTLGAMDAVNAVGDKMQERRLNDDLAKRNNVFNRYHTKGKDEGDYVAHATQKAGPNFRVNDYTRWGKGTKGAQDGYQVEDVLDLTEEEIRQLLAEGYELKYED